MNGLISVISLIGLGTVMVIIGVALLKKSTAKKAPAEVSAEDVKKERMDNVLSEGSEALREMGRLYHNINDKSIRSKINEIMLITDKIMLDAEEDPSDLPQIRRFFSYYLPTTIKLLKTYESLNSVGIDGENIDASKKNISDMLDTAIEAYKKRLDSLFENQALDIETDIDVMNQMMEREGLVSSGSGF